MKEIFKHKLNINEWHKWKDKNEMTYDLNKIT